MSKQTKAGTQTLDCSFITVDLKLSQESEMDFQEIETSVDELIVWSVDDRMKEATDPILKRIGKLCALLLGWNEYPARHYDCQNLLF